MTEAKKQRALESIFQFGIRQKVVLVLLAVLIISLAINGWFALQRQTRNALDETNKRGAAIARMVSTSLAYSVLGYDYHAIQILLDELVTTEFIVYARVENTKGTVMSEAGKLPEDAATALEFKENISFEGVQVGQLDVALSVANVLQDIKKERQHQTVREGFIILLVAFGEFIALSFIIVRPVTIISRSFRESINEQGEIVGHIPIQSNDEFGVLADQFNHLRDDLNEANRRLQSKINLADKKLLEANQKLIRQSLELKMKNQELQKLSLTDPLTGLYNRRQFENIIDAELSLALRHSEDLSLLVVDIDHFKSINDTHGHSAGDYVLKEIALILRKVVRRSDVLCRIGGEEFVVLGKHLKQIDAMVVAEKLRAAIERHRFTIENEALQVTSSFGVASVPSPFEIRTTAEFFNCADAALYYSKTHGRNRVTHFSQVADKIDAEGKSKAGTV